MNKLRLYVKSIIHSTFDNKLRAILSMIGIFIAVFLYFCGSVIMNSYAKTAYAEVESFRDNAFYVVGDSDNSLAKSIGTAPVSVFRSQAHRTIARFRDDHSNRYIMLYADVHYTTMNDNVFMTQSKNIQFIPFEGELIKGRFFTAMDFAGGMPSVIINETTERLLYPDGNSIGQIINFTNRTPSGDSYSENETPFSARVVGVIKDTIYDRQLACEFDEEIAHPRENQFSISLTVTVHIPSTALMDITAAVSDPVRIYAMDSDVAYKRALAKTLTESDSFISGERIYYTAKGTLLDIVDRQMARINAFFTTLIVVLGTLVGFSLSVTMTFSMKERVSELGIRKAFGASWRNIISMCATELVILSLIGGAVAVGLGYFVSSALVEYMTNHLYIFIIFYCSLGDLLLPLAVGVAFSLIFGSIPCLVAAFAKPIKALKFE